MLLHMYQVFITLLGHFLYYNKNRNSNGNSKGAFLKKQSKDKWRCNYLKNRNAINWKKKGINKLWFTMTNKKKTPTATRESSPTLPPPLPLFPYLFSTRTSWFSALISQQVFLSYFSHFFAFYGNYFKWVNIVKACFEKQLTREKAQEEKPWLSR